MHSAVVGGACTRPGTSGTPRPTVPHEQGRTHCVGCGQRWTGRGAGHEIELVAVRSNGREAHHHGSRPAAIPPGEDMNPSGEAAIIEPDSVQQPSTRSARSAEVLYASVGRDTNRISASRPDVMPALWTHEEAHSHSRFDSQGNASSSSSQRHMPIEEAVPAAPPPTYTEAT